MESVAQSIVSKVGQVLVEELKEIRGVGNKVVHLRDELATMNAVLRVISEADQDKVDHVVREWEKQVHDLVYDAENYTDIYSLRVARPIPLLTTDHIGGMRLTLWPRYLFARAKHIARYHYEKLVLQRTLAADINNLLARATIVCERRVRYGINRVALPRSARFAPVLAAYTLPHGASANALHRADDPDRFVGITELVKHLADKIKAPFHDEAEKRRLVFSIVGFGGLGKTTLAMELCRQLDADFPCQALVSVSQSFDPQKDMEGLLVRVLQQILKEKPKTNKEHLSITNMNVEELSIKIKELLNHKRYLIVIDDVWSLPALDAILVGLPENNCDSRIIVITRIQAVARAASSYFVHHMMPLGHESSKELLVRTVFGSMSAFPRELEDLIDMILKQSGGLPLAIVSIAGLLASYRSAEDTVIWESVYRSIGSHMETHPTLEGMRQLTTLCYDYLPRHLKACMLYLSILPENYVIAKDRLLYRWIVEGLVTENPGLTLLEVAGEYLNELIGRNMIQLDKCVSWGVEVQGCRVHDMILEVMVSKSKESNFVNLIGKQYRGLPYGHDKVRRLSLHGGDHDEQHHAVHGIEAMNVQYVRSLSTFQHYGLGFSKLLDRLGEFKLLRVLDLEDCKALQDEHMRDVCRLYLLGFLSLKGTNVSQMPRKVGNLEHLGTLDIRNTGIERRLPRTVTKLSKLERLRSNEWLLPRGLGNMKALHEVENGVITDDDVKVAQEICKLPQLVALSIRIENQ